MRKALSFLPVEHVDAVLHYALELNLCEKREGLSGPADCLAISIKDSKKPGRGIRQ